MVAQKLLKLQMCIPCRRGKGGQRGGLPAAVQRQVDAPRSLERAERVYLALVGLFLFLHGEVELCHDVADVHVFVAAGGVAEKTA